MQHAKHAVVAGLLGTAFSVAAGPISPPPGPVGDTYQSLGYKTLQQVEPRIPLSQDDVPIVISESGSYYLTSNLVPRLANQVAVQIAASNVTLDLSGHAIMNTAVDAFLDGVQVTGTRSNVAVHNGTIRGTFGNGVDTTNATGSKISDLRVSANGGSGIVTGPGALVIDCTSYNNFVYGFELGDGSEARGCSATSNTSSGFRAHDTCRVSDCVSNENGSVGFSLAGASIAVSGSTAQLNAGTGFAVFGTGTSVSDCTSRENTGNGFSTSVPAYGAKFDKCNAYDNTSAGFYLYNRGVIRDCVAVNNDEEGIYVRGIRSRIQGNHVTQNATGIGVHPSADENFIVQNTAATNGTDFDFAAGNTAGPVINGGGTIGTLNPWANFSY